MKILKQIKSILKNKKPKLFEGDSSIFLKHCLSISHYAEYGAGLSTTWVLENTCADIVSVETNEYWMNLVKAKTKNNTRVTLIYVDLGATENWGRPLTYNRRNYFSSYIKAIWTKKDFEPDFILIDGRFRVACFLTALICAKPGTKIVFDDYTNRSFYHIVEEFILRHVTEGRQALFIVPQFVNNIDEIKRLIDKFEYVFE